MYHDDGQKLKRTDQSMLHAGLEENGPHCSAAPFIAVLHCTVNMAYNLRAC